MAKEPGTIQIDISVDTRRDQRVEITLHPSVVHAHVGDTILWRSPHPFAVHFGGRTPFPKVFYQGTGELGAAVRDNADRGSYSYTAAVQVDGKVFIVKSDSVIIEDW
jgi:hypothetical protein